MGNRERRADLLIEYLHLIQDKFKHLSSQHLAALAEELRLSQTEVYEVASFYAHFDIVKEGEEIPPSLTIRVCDSLSCELAGAQDLLLKLGEKYNSGRDVRVVRAPCIGRCDTAPTLEIGHNHIDNANEEKVSKAIQANDVHAKIPNYQELKDYSACGGYIELKNLRGGSRTPDQIQDEILESGLRGIGGAGFPSGKKCLPRHLPPFVASVGIFNKPTLVHNVETLHWIAKIARDGSDVFGAHGAHLSLIHI